MQRKRRPYWQLPAGVTRGLWDYVQNQAVANDFDEFFAFNELFEFDERVLAEYLPAVALPQRVADFGCGTGRALIPLLRRGYAGLAVDLSPQMLAIVQQKCQEEQLAVDALRANLVQLDGLCDQCADHALCLFSTLGMIAGRPNRLQTLRHFRRILKPGGYLVLHVHNYWYNLFDPGGPWWLLKNLLRAVTVRDVEMGDKYFHYRGISNMFLHVFRRGEITRDLTESGFRIERCIALDRRRQAELRWPWLLGRVRANGWIFIARS